MLLAVAKNARQGKALPGDGPLGKVLRGLPVPDEVVRAEATRQLERFARASAPDGHGEVAWQRRHDRARRSAGHGPGQGLDGLLDEGIDQDEPLPARRDWTDAAAVFAHTLAGDIDSVAGEDLIRALLTAQGRTKPEIDQALVEVRAYETAGVDLAALLVPRLALRRRIQEIAVVDIDLFKRAFTAAGMVQAGHAALFIQALHTHVRREIGPTELDTLLPEQMHSVPRGVDALRSHPAWTWLSRIMPSSRHRLAETVLVAMIALHDRTTLAELEDYRDTLVAAMPFVSPSPQPPTPR